RTLRARGLLDVPRQVLDRARRGHADRRVFQRERGGAARRRRPLRAVLRQRAQPAVAGSRDADPDPGLPLLPRIRAVCRAAGRVPVLGQPDRRRRIRHRPPDRARSARPYLGLLVWPARLSYDYSWAQIRPGASLAGALVLLAAVGGLAVAWRRHRMAFFLLA